MVYTQEFKDYVQSVYRKRIVHYLDSMQLDLQLTTKCANACSYCGTDRFDETGEIDFGVLKAYVINYKKRAELNKTPFRVTLAGADVFLYTRYEELIEWLAHEKITFNILCNASTLTWARAEALKVANCQSVRMTLCGTPEQHNARRGIETFDQLIDRTRMLQDLCIPVIWHQMVDSGNIEGMKSMIPFIHSMNLDWITENRMLRSGMSKNDSFVDITSTQWRDFLLHNLRQCNADKNYNLEFLDKLWLPLLVEEGLLDLSEFDDDSIQCGCNTYSNVATLDFRGYIKGCNLFEAAAWATESTTKKIKFYPNDKYKVLTAFDIRKDDEGCKPCKYYNFCRGCRAMALGNTGNANAKDPHCWVEF